VTALTAAAGFSLYHVLVIVWHLVRMHRVTAPGADTSVEPEPAPPGEDPAHVDVVVPARNERLNLPACLPALLAQRGVHLHVVVVDDQSSDGTRAIAEEAARRDIRVRVVRGVPLPDGWSGKVHALHQGVAVTDAPWLLFVDADVVVHPDGIATAIRRARRAGVDLFSLSPLQRADTFGERLVQPLVFALLDERFSMAAVNDPAQSVAAVNGQFLLVRRDAYRAIGGHAAVRGDVLEDVALARRAKRQGRPLFFGRTDRLVAARMYRGFGALWEGWSKNLFLLLGSRSVTAAWIALRGLLVWVVPLVTVPVAAAFVRGFPPGAVAGAAVAMLALAVVFLHAGRFVPRPALPAWYRFCVPFGTLVVVVLIVASWWKHVVARRVSWRGRTYPAHLAGDP
jgi:glycosyltransferase involved in cell wall biosynthesis